VIVFEEMGLNHLAEDSAFSCYGAEQLSQTSTVDCFQSSWTVAPLLTFHIFTLPNRVLLKINFQFCTLFDVVLYLYYRHFLSSWSQVGVL